MSINHLYLHLSFFYIKIGKVTTKDILDKGILLMLLSSMGFSLIAMFVKLAGDISAIQKTL